MMTCHIAVHPLPDAEGEREEGPFRHHHMAKCLFRSGRVDRVRVLFSILDQKYMCVQPLKKSDGVFVFAVCVTCTLVLQ
jgi:hypothetical protein